MANEGESKYGFKDKSVAEESIKLLKSEDPQYQKLTVRGLLSRAKRVLTLTKAEEKIKNINDAIEVFENWLKENGSELVKQNKPVNEDKPDTVPGLGFKDKEAALKTLEILEGRDPEYQKLAVKGLIGSSKRVLSGTKNPDKVKSIKEGVEVLENFLEKFEMENYMKDNYKYLNYDLIKKLPEPNNELVVEFLQVFGKTAKGNYKHLRTLYPSTDDKQSWDIIRNREIKKIKEKINDKKISVFTSEGEPTDDHYELIYWAYSPQPDKVKYFVEKLSKDSKKRSSSNSSENEIDSEDDNGSDSDVPTKKKRKH